MSSEHDIESRIERWLKDDARPLPPHVLRAVREAVPQVSQAGRRPILVPAGWSRWSRRFGLAAAAVILVVVAGPTALDDLRSILRWSSGAGPGIVTPGPSASASPGVQGSPSPTLEAPASTDPFTGTWSAFDVDGSVTTLTFDGSGPTRTIASDDLRATACGGGHYVVEGSGTLAGASIHVVGRGGCAGQPMDQAYETTFTYDSATGALTSPIEGIPGLTAYTWTRSIKVDAFSGTWIATGIGGGSMTLTFSGSGLTRDVTFADDRSVDCPAGGRFSATGSATIGSVAPDGRYVSVSLAGACPGGASPRSSVAKYGYDFATGTLIGPLAPLATGGSPTPDTVSWRRP